MFPHVFLRNSHALITPGIIMPIREDNKKKRQEFIDSHINPYNNSFKREMTLREFREKYGSTQSEDPTQGPLVKLAGRLKSIRLQGKVIFADLIDMECQDLNPGDKDYDQNKPHQAVQMMFRYDTLGEDLFNIIKKLMVGDIIGVEGRPFRSRRGEFSAYAEKWVLLTKAINQLPLNYFELKDVEVRYRQRYIDIAVNKPVRDKFVMRSKIIYAIRQLLSNEGFYEVETPTLQVLYGGANARPFVTHYNFLDQEVYLRIAPELYLKRLIVGGLEKIFEIGKVFRNEGIDTRHNPEFTILELYQAFADFTDMMEITKKIVQAAVKLATGGPLQIKFGDKLIDFSEFDRLPMYEAIRKYTGFDPANAPSREDVMRYVQDKLENDELRRAVTSTMNRAEILYQIFDKDVENQLVNPTFITDFPIEVSPLARRQDATPELVDRFELFANGWELANAFSELNDPVDQEERFIRQKEAKATGDDEAMPYDKDYVYALEYGMPPTGGLGIGVDRLVMLCTDSQSIKDVLLFPHMRTVEAAPVEFTPPPASSEPQPSQNKPGSAPPKPEKTINKPPAKKAAKKQQKKIE